MREIRCAGFAVVLSLLGCGGGSSEGATGLESGMGGSALSGGSMGFPEAGGASGSGVVGAAGASVPGAGGVPSFGGMLSDPGPLGGSGVTQAGSGGVRFGNAGSGGRVEGMGGRTGKGSGSNGGNVTTGGTQSSNGSAGGPSATTPDGKWKLAWSDEFEGSGAVNSAYWSFESGFVRNDEAQYYTNRLENVRQEDGMLVIEARKESFKGADYTSASVHTRGKQEFLYGRIEVRAKVPGGVGTWPAIWTKGVRGAWPRGGEIDIMEHVGFDADSIHFTIHTAADESGENNEVVEVPNPHQNFHVYAVEWFEDRLDFYLDEEKVWTFENDGGGTDSWPFVAPQYLLLNLAIGGNWGGQEGIDDSIFPCRYYIDYVRYYTAE